MSAFTALPLTKPMIENLEDLEYQEMTLVQAEFGLGFMYLAAKRSGRNAWVTIFPTDIALSDDLTPDLAKHLPVLIQDGKLKMKTSLKKNNLVYWAD